MQRVLDTLALSDRARTLLNTSSPDPKRAAEYLIRLQAEKPDAYRRLDESPTGLQFLVSVFSYSHFLADDVLQHPDWVESLIESGDLYRVLSPEEYTDRLNRFLGSADTDMPPALSLALFRRQQILRIALRDIQGACTLAEATQELSNLADAILEVAYRRIRSHMVSRYGVPRDADGEECGFSVIALGKLGGRELNYSSDIDLMFLYSGNGETDGPQKISTKEFYKKIANLYTELLSTYTAEGLCYRVDLRLRPDGSLGEVCLSLEGAKHYYESRARDWELQMLIKARVAAGDASPGRELLDFVEPRIYSTTLDFSAVEAVSATRERISEKLTSKRTSESGLNIKLTRGGIRDVEFLVQCLQRLHGGREPWVQQGGSLFALRRLRDKDLLSDSEYSRLACAYQFLRYVEHRLQLVEDRQTHTLPVRREELDLLARRMPAAELGRQPSADKLRNQLNGHLEEVQETYDRVIHSQQPLYYSSAPVVPREPPADEPEQNGSEAAASNLMRFLDQRAPHLATTIAQYPPRRAHRAFEHFLEKIYSSSERLAVLNADPQLARDIVDLFENSPHFAEELIRHPESIDELSRMRQEADANYDEAARLRDSNEIRRYFKREMLRIQAESICLKRPIFDTLGRTSDLADAVICAAYRLAVEQVKQSRPPQSQDYAPADQMMVIAMGRLGMREFDLGSDADLTFVLPDEDASEMLFWTRVAERVINIITSYTGEGVMFVVDTRLRPNGREGSLVQTVNAYQEYLSKNAEAWEGITYMKSRAVAGNADKATRFLHELQEVDWRRYGQSGRSRTDLRNMRARLEAEQGAQNPLKAGPGGYYDIDFAMMYLRLKGGGIFYKTLNTPERIDIIEKMGHLDRADAEFLLDAASLYRAIDHGLRVYSGHAEGRLPNSSAQLDVLTNLVRRWTPDHLHDQPLPEKLAQIQERTRQYFRRLFG